MKPVILACPFDNGIRSMLHLKRGVTGAANGPKAILESYMRRYTNDNYDLMTLPISKFNSEDLSESGKDARHESTIKAHRVISQISELVSTQNRVILSLGGDHSITYPLLTGLSEGRLNKKIGVIYFDSHLDMRSVEEEGIISSGNSFWRLLEDGSVDGRNIVAVGVKPGSDMSFTLQRDYALSKGAKILYSHDYNNIAENALAAAGDGTDLIYVSIDMDVLHRMFAPGVSSPSDMGMTSDQLMSSLRIIFSDPRTVACDITETSLRKKHWQEVVLNERMADPHPEKDLEITADLAADIMSLFLQNT